MISLPEIGIEAAEKNPRTHDIGAIKHQGGIEKRLSEKYEGKYGEDRYNNKIMESRIDDPLLGAWNNLLFFLRFGFHLYSYLYSKSKPNAFGFSIFLTFLFFRFYPCSVEQNFLFCKKQV